MLHSHTSFASRIQQQKIIEKYGVVQKLWGSTFWGRQNADWAGYMGLRGVAQTGDIVISFEL